MPKISILGCGWLGLPLGKALIENGYAVNGSTTTAAKMPLLSAAGISPHLITVNPDSVHGDLESFLEDCDTLIIDIPPKLRNDTSESFVSKVKTLVPYIEKGKVTNVIFISSISVYGDDMVVVTEETMPNPATASGKQLWESETILMRNNSFTTAVVRFGGLTGNDRHPVYHLAGKGNIESPDAPVNLIHQLDCIGIIISLLKTETTGGIFNAVAPFHPSRKEYYQAKAASMNLQQPDFVPTKHPSGKIVSAEKLQRDLGYRFLVTTEI